MTTRLIEQCGARPEDGLEKRREKALTWFPFLQKLIALDPRELIDLLYRIQDSASIDMSIELNLRMALKPLNALIRAQKSLLDATAMTDKELLSIKGMGPYGIKLINALVIGQSEIEQENPPDYKELSKAINLKSSQLVRLVRIVWYDLFPNWNSTDKVAQEETFNQLIDLISNLALVYASALLTGPLDTIFDQKLEKKLIKEIFSKLKNIYKVKSMIDLWNILFTKTHNFAQFLDNHLLTEVFIVPVVFELSIQKLALEFDYTFDTGMSGGVSSLTGDIPPDRIFAQFDRIFIDELQKFHSILVLGDLASGLLDTALLFKYLQISPELYRARQHNDTLAWYQHSTQKLNARGPILSPLAFKALFGDALKHDAIILVTEFSVTGASVLNTAKEIREKHPHIPIYIFVGSGINLSDWPRNLINLFGLDSNVSQQPSTSEKPGYGAQFYKYVG